MTIFSNQIYIYICIYIYWNICIVLNLKRFLAYIVTATIVLYILLLFEIIFTFFIKIYIHIYRYYGIIGVLSSYLVEIHHVKSISSQRYR